MGSIFRDSMMRLISSSVVSSSSSRLLRQSGIFILADVRLPLGELWASSMTMANLLPAMLVSDLVENEGEFLDGCDDDLLAIT